MDEIILEKARIGNIVLKQGAKGFRIQLVAIATSKVARSIDAGWLLDKNSLLRHGFSLTKSDFVLVSARLKHAVDKLSQIEVVSDKVHQFKVFRIGDGKKQSKRLMISLAADVVGPPFEVLEHWLKIGGGEGVCTLEPMQAELFDGAGNGKSAMPLAPAKKAAKKTAPVKSRKMSRAVKREAERVDRAVTRRSAAADAPAVAALRAERAPEAS